MNPGVTSQAASPSLGGSLGQLLRAQAQSLSRRKSLWACGLVFLALALVAPDRLGAALALLYVAIVIALLRVNSGAAFLRALPVTIGVRWLAALATLLAPAFVPFGPAGGRGAEALAAAVLALFYGGVLLRGGERLAQLAARFGLDALPGEQQRIEAERRAGSLGTQGARSAQNEVRAGLGLLGTTDGLVALLRIEFAAFVLVLLAALAVSVGFGGMGLAPALSQHGRFALVLLLPTCLLAVRLLDEGVRLSLGTRAPANYRVLCVILAVLGISAAVASPIAALPLVALMVVETLDRKQRTQPSWQTVTGADGILGAAPTTQSEHGRAAGHGDRRAASAHPPHAPKRFALPVAIDGSLRTRLSANLPALPFAVELAAQDHPDAHPAAIGLPDALGVFDAAAWATARGVTLGPGLLPVSQRKPDEDTSPALTLADSKAWPNAVIDAAIRQVGADLLDFETTLAALEHYRNGKREEVRRRLEQSAVVERLWRLQRELALQGLVPSVPRLIDSWLRHCPGLDDGKADDLASALAFDALRAWRAARIAAATPTPGASMDAPWRVLLVDPLVESEVQGKTTLGPSLKQDVRKAFLDALKGWAQPEPVVILTGPQARKPLATLCHREHAATFVLDQSTLPPSLRIKRAGFIAP